jgi:hypothetical protein
MFPLSGARLLSVLKRQRALAQRSNFCQYRSSRQAYPFGNTFTPHRRLPVNVGFLHPFH